MELNNRLIQLMNINEIAVQEKRKVEEEIAQVATKCFETRFSVLDVSFKDDPFCYTSITLKTNKELSVEQLTQFCYTIGFQLLDIETRSSLAYGSPATTTYKYIFNSKHISTHYINRDTKWELKINK